MSDILTITLNPTVDLSTATDAVRPGPKLRCDVPQADPGGGGINVSRAIHTLGGDSAAFVAVGGQTGQRVLSLLASEGVQALPFAAPGETRQSLAVHVRGTEDQYRFVMPGPQWGEAEVSLALTALGQALTPNSVIVLSGSQPPGVPLDFASRVAEVAAENAARLVLDTSGPALAEWCATSSAPPRAHTLRMDQEEAEGLAGHPLTSRADSADFAQGLVMQGAAQVVIVARGADGSTLATADQRLHAQAANVPVVSKVGAGDSFVAAFALALARDEALANALQKGAACASAAVMTEATRLCTRADAERLIDACPVSKV